MARKGNRGVADFDGTRELHHNPNLDWHKPSKTVYSTDENVILNSIQAIRRTYPDKREQLHYFYKLKELAESSDLDPRGRDSMSDIRLAIDEIEIDLGIG